MAGWSCCSTLLVRPLFWPACLISKHKWRLEFLLCLFVLDLRSAVSNVTNMHVLMKSMRHWPEDFNPFLMTNCNCMRVPCFITYIVLTPSNVFFNFYFLDCSLCVHVVLMIWTASLVITVHWCHSEKLEWARNTVTVLHQTTESTELHCSLWDSAKKMYDLLLKPSVWNHYYFTMIFYACWSFWKKNC